MEELTVPKDQEADSQQAWHSECEQIRANTIRLPGLDKLGSQYRLCMKICSQAQNLTIFAADFHRLAINIEITAAKQSTNQLIFAVLGKELQALSVMISENIAGIINAASKLAANAVNASRQIRICDLYSSALQFQVRPANARRISAAHHKMGGYYIASLANMERELQQTLVRMNDLSRLSIHIPAVANLLRIESCNCETGTESRLKGVADRLIVMTQKLNHQLESLLNQLRLASSTIKTLL